MKSQRRILVAGWLLTLAGATLADGVPGQGTWETTLLPRDLDGSVVNGPEAFYDTALDVTWLRNANANKRMTWYSANAWATSLVVGKVGGWRLPALVDTGAPGCDFSDGGGTECGYNVPTASSELAHLYYVTLGNLAPCRPGDNTCADGLQPGAGLTNTGDFQKMRADGFWTGTDYAPASGSGAWCFYTNGGGQGGCDKRNWYLAMAVHPGDVAGVPEVATYGMMLIGLGMVVFTSRQRKSTLA